MSKITEEMAQRMRGPVMIAICTVNENREPFFTRGWGVRASAGVDTVHCYIPQILSKRPLQDLQINTLLAINAVDATNFQGYQFKGKFLASDQATAEEEQWLLDQQRTSGEVVGQFFGAPAGEGWNRFIITPSVRLTMEVAEVYNQAPGAMTAEERRLV
ncbi:MAG: hypothetical protein KDK37_19010 [Leptospiraceae bacterium]|nr:hypothetical protein [Leptospiraceae bacterium]MCB1306391.1 hypothetical protein [Leptospiraceae bacterium]